MNSYIHIYKYRSRTANSADDDESAAVGGLNCKYLAIFMHFIQSKKTKLYRRAARRAEAEVDTWAASSSDAPFIETKQTANNNSSESAAAVHTHTFRIALKSETESACFQYKLEVTGSIKRTTHVFTLTPKWVCSVRVSKWVSQQKLESTCFFATAATAAVAAVPFPFQAKRNETIW